MSDFDPRTTKPTVPGKAEDLSADYVKQVEKDELRRLHSAQNCSMNAKDIAAINLKTANNVVIDNPADPAAEKFLKLSEATKIVADKNASQIEKAIAGWGDSLSVSGDLYDKARELIHTGKRAEALQMFKAQVEKSSAARCEPSEAEMTTLNKLQTDYEKTKKAGGETTFFKSCERLEGLVNYEKEHGKSETISHYVNNLSLDPNDGSLSMSADAAALNSAYKTSLTNQSGQQMTVSPDWMLRSAQFADLGVGPDAVQSIRKAGNAVWETMQAAGHGQLPDYDHIENDIKKDSATVASKWVAPNGPSLEKIFKPELETCKKNHREE
ncbi:MAG: hypothetical protein PHC51_06470 [bacterium]|nr:hypothetical protein [bacterium]